jgi:adenine phosphoribosyltransferase
MWEGNRHAGMYSNHNEEVTEYFSKYCRTIKDFPKPGISFRDITPLLAESRAFNRAITQLSWRYIGQVDSIVCVESRGFLIGSAMAYYLNCGLIPVRKQGKLPAKTLKITYDLEYGTDTLEIHKDSIKSGQRILIVDDVLATGGTAKAVVDLVTNMEANLIGCAFLGEITSLNGRSKLNVPVYSLIKF